jgi:hypothetical protein
MQYAPRGVTPIVAEQQARRYREMSPSEKLALADGLWDLAWDAAKAGVRWRRPEMDEASVEAEARKLLHDASD